MKSVFIEVRLIGGRPEKIDSILNVLRKEYDHIFVSPIQKNHTKGGWRRYATVQFEIEENEGDELSQAFSLADEH